MEAIYHQLLDFFDRPFQFNLFIAQAAVLMLMLMLMLKIRRLISKCRKRQFLEVFGVRDLVLSRPRFSLFAFDAGILAVTFLERFFFITTWSEILAFLSIILLQFIVLLNIIDVISEAPLSVVLVLVMNIFWRIFKRLKVVFLILVVTKIIQSQT